MHLRKRMLQKKICPYYTTLLQVEGYLKKI